jgi:hypothetical protein
MEKVTQWERWSFTSLTRQELRSFASTTWHWLVDDGRPPQLLTGRNIWLQQGYDTTAGMKVLTNGKLSISLHTTDKEITGLHEYPTAANAERPYLKSKKSVRPSTTAQGHHLTNHGCDEVVAMWTKIYLLKLVSDDNFRNCECRHCQLAKAEHPPVKSPRSDPRIHALDRTDALMVDFNVIHRSKSKKKARSWAKSLFNMMHARSGCVTIVPFAMQEEIVDRMPEILTAFMMNLLRKHGWEIRVLYVDKESVLISSSLRALVASPPFAIEISQEMPNG